MPRTKKQAVKIVRPEQPESRDEGPRLLPLKEASSDDMHTAKLQHYIKLADIALKSPPADTKTH